MKYEFDFRAPLAYWPDFLAAAGTTLGLSLTATLPGFLPGVSWAVASTGRTPWLSSLSSVYVEQDSPC